jgi:hypothetical protein
MEDESVFYFMVYILKTYRQICTYYLIKDDNFKNPGFVNRQNYVYLILLEKFMPKVHKKLLENNIDAIMYTPAWFLTLFSKSLDE